MRYYLLLMLLIGNLSFAQNIDTSGTLVVTWKTDDKGTLLDRIGFWLQNDHFEQTFYPKSNAFVEDPKDKSRTVVIENLPPGVYSLKFLIPNKRKYFEPLEPKTFQIEEREVVKINQTIHPKSTKESS